MNANRALIISLATATMILLLIVVGQTGYIIGIREAVRQPIVVPSTVAEILPTPSIARETSATARVIGAPTAPPTATFIRPTLPVLTSTPTPTVVPTNPPTPTSVRTGAQAASQGSPTGTTGTGSNRGASTPTTPLTVQSIPIQANDLVYDPGRKRIYASVPGSAIPYGNSVVVIDPATKSIEEEILVGSDPNKLALSDDGHFLYIALDGAGEIRRLDLQSRKLNDPFTLGSEKSYGPYFVAEMAVVPGDPGALAVSRRNSGVSPSHAGVAIYREGKMLPLTTARHTGSNSISFCGSSSWLYGYNNESTEYGFREMVVGTEGVRITGVKEEVITGFSQTITCDGGLIYATSGQVVDPSTKGLVGTYGGVAGGSLVRPDARSGKTYFVVPATTASTTKYKLLAFEQRTFRLLNSFDLPELVGEASHPLQGGARSLIRWGDDGLAYRSKGQLFLVQSAAFSRDSGETTAQPRGAVTDERYPVRNEEPISAIWHAETRASRQER